MSDEQWDQLGFVLITIGVVGTVAWYGHMYSSEIHDLLLMLMLQ